MADPAYVAVDWGTSSFRLWLIGDRMAAFLPKAAAAKA